MNSSCPRVLISLYFEQIRNHGIAQIREHGARAQVAMSLRDRPYAAARDNHRARFLECLGHNRCKALDQEWGRIVLVYFKRFRRGLVFGETMANRDLIGCRVAEGEPSRSAVEHSDAEA